MRTAQLAALIAAEEGADPARAAFLALWHDTQETRTGDLPHTASAYLTKPDPRKITADQSRHPAAR
jgi:putative hydrolase of HD superfamily